MLLWNTTLIMCVIFCKYQYTKIITFSVYMYIYSFVSIVNDITYLIVIVYVYPQYLTRWHGINKLSLSLSAFRHGMCTRRTSNLHHARQRLAWLPPGINQSPPGAHCVWTLLKFIYFHRNKRMITTTVWVCGNNGMQRHNIVFIKKIWAAWFKYYQNIRVQKLSCENLCFKVIKCSLKT